MPDQGVLADRTRRIRRCLSEDRGDDAMNDPTIETLARRLDKVERENRWLKRAGVVALAVIGAVVLMGQSRVAEARSGYFFRLFSIHSITSSVLTGLAMKGWPPMMPSSSFLTVAVKNTIGVFSVFSSALI